MQATGLPEGWKVWNGLDDAGPVSEITPVEYTLRDGYRSFCRAEELSWLWPGLDEPERSDVWDNDIVGYRVLTEEEFDAMLRLVYGDPMRPIIGLLTGLAITVGAILLILIGTAIFHGN